MTFRHRLRRLERTARQERGDDQDQWVRGLSDEDLEARIAVLRAKAGEDEYARCQQAIQDGPDAIRAWLTRGG
jgi:hypothetical protein